MKMIKWLSGQNFILKPLGVLVNVSAPLIYVLYQTSDLIIEEIDPGIVAVSNGLLVGLRGSIALLIIMLSIIQIYKPPKGIVISLTVGGVMLFAGSLFTTLGIALLLYGLSNLLNRYTIAKLVDKNDRIKKYKEDLEIERLSKGE